MADFCKTCKHCDTGVYDEPCFSCRTTGGGIPTKWEAKENGKPQTNADRIRAMSDEDLAEYIDSVAEACYNAGAEDLPLSNSNPLSNAYNILEWLKQPAEE